VEQLIRIFFKVLYIAKRIFRVTVVDIRLFYRFDGLFLIDKNALLCYNGFCTKVEKMITGILRYLK